MKQLHITVDKITAIEMPLHRDSLTIQNKHIHLTLSLKIFCIPLSIAHSS